VRRFGDPRRAGTHERPPADVETSRSASQHVKTIEGARSRWRAPAQDGSLKITAALIDLRAIQEPGATPSPRNDRPARVDEHRPMGPAVHDQRGRRWAALPQCNDGSARSAARADSMKSISRSARFRSGNTAMARPARPIGDAALVVPGPSAAAMGSRAGQQKGVKTSSCA